MAYNNNYSSRSFSPRPAPQQPPEIKALPLPEDYVDEAERVMLELSRLYNLKAKLSTSKIRNLFSLISEIYNVENLRSEAELKPESRAALNRMRIRIVYEAGRDRNTVGTFVEKAKLLEYIKDIKNDRVKLINFAHYMEALVAYHRFLICEKEG